MLKLAHRGFYEILGDGPVLLTAPHAGGPAADLLTGDIVEGVSLRSGCPAIVGNTSREKMDLNRAQAFETDFRECINRLVESGGISLIIDVHGKEESGVEVGTASGKTASEKTIDLVCSCLSRQFEVEVDKKFKGLKHGSIITTHSRKDSLGAYLTEAVQLEFGFKERSRMRDRAITGISEIVSQINSRSQSANPAT